METDSGLEVERMAPEVFAKFFRRTFKPGQHVFIVGPTGCGKSLLINDMVRGQSKRNWVILDAKGGDDPSLEVDGFDLIRDWPPPKAPLKEPKRSDLMGRIRDAFHLDPVPDIASDKGPLHVRLGPAVNEYGDLVNMRDVFDRALKDLFTRKGEDVFSIVIDEAQIIADPREGMGLGKRIGPILRQKRYHDCSLVLATQFPVWIPKSSHREARHRFFYRLWEEEAQRDAGALAGDRRRIPAILDTLGDHEFLYQDIQKRLLIRSKVDIAR